MFERFSDKARKVMALADEEAQRCNHKDISSIEVLLGIIKESSGVACVALRNLDVDLGKVLQRCEQRLKRIKIIRQEDSAKGVVNSAIEEARSLNSNYVGTEHLLLGILRQEKSRGAQILREFNLKIKAVRAEVTSIWKAGKKETVSTPLLAKKMAEGTKILAEGTKTLASIIEKKEKERPVKCEIFQIGEKVAVYGEAKPFRFEPIEERLSSGKAETEITDFLSDGKELVLVRVVQSSVSFGVASAVVLTQIIIFYRDKGS